MTDEEWRRLFKDTVILSLICIVSAGIMGFLIGWFLTF